MEVALWVGAVLQVQKTFQSKTLNLIFVFNSAVYEQKILKGWVIQQDTDSKHMKKIQISPCLKPPRISLNVAFKEPDFIVTV